MRNRIAVRPQLPVCASENQSSLSHSTCDTFQSLSGGGLGAPEIFRRTATSYVPSPSVSLSEAPPLEPPFLLAHRR